LNVPKGIHLHFAYSSSSCLGNSDRACETDIWLLLAQMLVCVFCFLHILQGSGSIVLANRLDKTYSWINEEANLQAAM
jgi:hypothetical protein